MKVGEKGNGVFFLLVSESGQSVNKGCRTRLPGSVCKPGIGLLWLFFLEQDAFEVC